MVASSFGVSPPPAGSGSLLHERFRLLKWFSEHHPDELDFFCRGLDTRELQSLRGAGLLRRVLPAGFFTWLGERRRRVFSRVYRGAIPPDDKVSRLRDYRFSIAYENTGDLPGYLTEKIFDCFAAAVLPVYLGDPHVAQAIPPACFIDRRRFASHEALYQHLRQMSYDEYAHHIAAIQVYLGGADPARRTSAANARAIADLAVADLGSLPG